MPTSLRGAFGNAAPSPGDIATATLPTGIQDGDIGLLVCSINSSSNFATPPDGWTLVEGPINNTNVIHSYLFKRTMAAADSGTTVSVTWSGSGRWNLGGAVVAGGSETDTVVLGTDTTLDTQLVVPDYTPSADDAFAVLLVNSQHPNGQPTGLVTSPAGWSKDVEAITGSTGVHTACTVLTRQLVGGSGQVHGGGVGTWAGNSRNNQWIVTVAPAAPTGPVAPSAAFTSSPASGPAPLDVTFTDTSAGDPTAWAWDFGDGGTSTAQHPTHTFATPGTYTVTLTASNAEGSDTTTATVTALDPSALVLPGFIYGVEPESHDYNAVFQDGDGAFYRLTENSLADIPENAPRWNKSTDGGQTWAAQDLANAGSMKDIESAGIYHDKANATLWVSNLRSGEVLEIIGFNTSDHPTNPDAFAGASERIGTVGGNVSTQHTATIGNADGTLWIFHSDWTTGKQLHYRKRNTNGTFTSPTALQSDVAEVMAPRPIKGDGDLTWVFYKDEINHRLYYKTLTTAGSLSAATRVDSGGTNSIETVLTYPVRWVQGGTERFAVAFADPVGNLRVVRLAGGTPGVEETVPSSAVAINPEITANKSPVASLTVDDDTDTLHLIWSRATDMALMHSQSVAGGAWTTPTVLTADAYALWAYASVVTYGSERWLAYTWNKGPSEDDTGNIWFDRMVLTAAPPSVDITVEPARAESRAERAALTQRAPLTVAAARSAARASSPTVAQATDLTATDARAATRSTPVALTQRAALTVAHARAEARTTATDVTQHTPLTAPDVRAETRATAVSLALATSIAVHDAQAEARAGGALLDQASPLAVTTARSATRATGAALTQTQPVTIETARAATSATRATLAQNATLTLTGLRADTRAGTAALTHATPLTVRAARAGTRAGSPLLRLAGDISVNGARTRTRANRPALTHAQTITTADVRAETRVGRADVEQATPLTVAAVRAVTSATTPRLTAPSAIRHVRAETRADSPVLTQHTALTVTDVRATTTATAPLVSSALAITVHGARADTSASVPAVDQHHLLDVAGARAPTRARRVVMPGAIIPTAPPDRTYTVSAESRTLTVPVHNRTLTVPAESRTLTA